MKITKILKENLWDKLVKAYPELEDETSVEETVVEEVVETNTSVTEEVITEEKNPWDKLVDMYPELSESTVEESFDEDGNREYCDECGTPLNDGGTCPKCDDGEEDYGEMLTEGNNVSSQLTPALDSFLQDIAQIHGTISYKDIMDHEYTEEDIKKLRSLRKQWREEAQYDDDETDTILGNIADEVASILKAPALEEGRQCDACEKEYGDTSNTDESWIEYDDEYDFDNEDDVVTQDRMHAALYGGDREYCDKCGSKLVRDEWGGTCPRCNETEIEMSHQDALYDDLDEEFDDCSSYIAKETSYEVAHKIAVMATKELDLDEYDAEMLEHDINNLRSNEWVDTFSKLSDDSDVKKLFFTSCVECEDSLDESKKFAGKSTNLGTMTREEALKRAQEMLEKIKDTDQECAGLLYGLIDKETGEEFFTPECVTHADAEKLAKALDFVYILWNKSAKSPELD